jgi:hypothetical protein
MEQRILFQKISIQTLKILERLLNHGRQKKARFELADKHKKVVVTNPLSQIDRIGQHLRNRKAGSSRTPLSAINLAG